LVGDELIEKIKDVHIIGIRSKTKLTKAVLDEAKSLIGIGCFCIGTNQVDLKCAADKGVSHSKVKFAVKCDNNLILQ
jgi:D-3-phosphoglycerate dehydrogenase